MQINGTEFVQIMYFPSLFKYVNSVVCVCLCVLICGQSYIYDSVSRNAYESSILLQQNWKYFFLPGNYIRELGQITYTTSSGPHIVANRSSILLYIIITNAL